MYENYKNSDIVYENGLFKIDKPRGEITIRIMSRRKELLERFL